MDSELIRPVVPADDTRPKDTRLKTTGGFTLIELLVVIAVMSVLAVGAVLAAGRGGNTGESDAATFHKTYATLRALAVHSQQRQGLMVTPREHRRAQRIAGDWQVSGQPRSWRARVLFTSIGQQPGYEEPQLVFLPNGQTSAFSIIFSGGGQGRRIRCFTDGWAELQCAPG